MKNHVTETNYCAHAVDDLKFLLSGELSPSDRGTLTELRQGIEDSLHFRLPDEGVIFEIKTGEKITSLIKDYCPHFRLPFPSTTLEFTSQRVDREYVSADGYVTYDASIILLKECTNPDGSRAVLMRPMVRTAVGNIRAWLPEPYAAIINAETLAIEALWQTDEAKNAGTGVEQAEIALGGVLTVLVGFLSALTCSNSATADAPLPSVSLNAKRRKSGKTPFFSYKILTINTGVSPANKGDKIGTHGSPRVHLRRGHIRRLPGKTVWVNASVVGDKSRGFVQKDYKIT